MNSNTIAIIIVAAGNGSRFGGDTPKQFCLLEGKPVLMHSIERFHNKLPNAQITVVLSAERVDYWNELCHNYDLDIPHSIAIGGTTRWESVKNALETVSQTASIIMVHDGARPLVTEHTIDALCQAIANGADGALPVLPMVDSIRLQTAEGSEAVDRSKYVSVQTPQAFPANLLKEAYQLPYAPNMTDDASVMEIAGHKNIALVDGNAATLKITRSEDLDITALYLRHKH